MKIFVLMSKSKKIFLMHYRHPKVPQYDPKKRKIITKYHKIKKGRKTKILENESNQFFMSKPHKFFQTLKQS